MKSKKEFSLLVNKPKKFKIWYLTKTMLIKHLINPLWIFLGYASPIGMLVILYFQGLNNFKTMYSGSNELFPPEIQAFSTTPFGLLQMRSNLVWLTGILLIPVCYFGIISFSLIFGAAKSLNLTKIYSTLNISPEKYFLANFVINLIQTAIVINLILLIYNFLMLKNLEHLDQFMIPASQYFVFIFIGIFGFFITFGFSALISTISDRASIILSIAFLYYLVCLTTSGTLVSAQLYDNTPNDPHPWFKWLQYATPIGSAQRLNIIEINATWNFEKVGDSINPDTYYNYTEFTNWSTDWLAFLSPIVQNVVLWIIVFKLGVWRYHRDINTQKLQEIPEITFEQNNKQLNVIHLEANQKENELEKIYTEIKILENKIQDLNNYLEDLNQEAKSLEAAHSEII